MRAEDLVRYIHITYDLVVMATSFRIDLRTDIIKQKIKTQIKINATIDIVLTLTINSVHKKSK